MYVSWAGTLFTQHTSHLISLLSLLSRARYRAGRHTAVNQHEISHRLYYVDAWVIPVLIEANNRDSLSTFRWIASRYSFEYRRIASRITLEIVQRSFYIRCKIRNAEIDWSQPNARRITDHDRSVSASCELHRRGLICCSRIDNCRI